MRKMVCLDGLWQRSVAGGPWLAQRVPYSAHICGESEVSTRFSRPEGQRVMLRFEGITYWGECLVNGVKMGEMPAYSRCEFDVTDVLQPGDNLLQVRLKDMGVAFGPSEGWENYGGIIRSVYLDVLPEAYIRDVFFHTDMAADMKTAAAHVDVQAAGEGACTARLLDRNGDMVACASGVLAEGKCSLSFALDRPRLWSPEDPYLYTLESTLKLNGDDTVIRHVNQSRIAAVSLKARTDKLEYCSNICLINHEKLLFDNLLSGKA